MRKALTFGLAAVALGATLTYVAARSPQAEPFAVADASAAVLTQYGAGPRIIHVPQPGERRARANAPERDDLYVDDHEDDYVPPRRRAAPKPQKRSDAPPAEPRRKPFNSSPPPQPRRTVLSAPPSAPDYSLTPIRPTPRFGVKPESGEKFATTPPPGYKPPSALPPPKSVPAPKPESIEANEPAATPDTLAEPPSQ